MKYVMLLMVPFLSYYCVLSSYFHSKNSDSNKLKKRNSIFACTSGKIHELHKIIYPSRFIAFCNYNTYPCLSQHSTIIVFFSST